METFLDHRCLMMFMKSDVFRAHYLIGITFLNKITFAIVTKRKGKDVYIEAGMH